MADQELPPQGSLVPPAGGGGDGANKNLVPINIEDEMRRSYLDYAMSVIVGRALPDIRDGLKPVHRRILYAMSEMGLAFNRGYRKCAGAVGMATNIPSHNLTEIIDATILLIQKPDTPLTEILKIVQGPDFATGGLILGRQG